MNVADCLRLGWLKKEKPDLKKAMQSIKVSEAKLSEAEKAFNSTLIEPTIVFSYASMFHSGRAILFKEGFREKGHIPLLIYLEEKHSRFFGKKLLFDFNTMRLERHDSLYGLEPSYSGEDAKYAIETAKQFLKMVKKYIQGDV